MEYVAEIMPLLWEIVGVNKKCSVNVTTKETEIIVSILKGKRWKIFKGATSALLMDRLRKEYLLN